MLRCLLAVFASLLVLALPAAARQHWFESQSRPNENNWRQRAGRETRESPL